MKAFCEKLTKWLAENKEMAALKTENEDEDDDDEDDKGESLMSISC